MVYTIFQQGIGGYILNAINNYDIPQGNYDGANNAHEEPFLDNYVQPALSAAIMYAPNVAIPNDIKILTTGKDIYENKQGTLDKIFSAADIITFGGMKMAKPIVNQTSKLVNMLTTAYSIRSTYKNESKKRNEKK